MQMKIVKYYLSPLSHKVVGAEVQNGKGKGESKNNVIQVFIPCFPSPVPINSIDTDLTYDIPPDNDYDEVKVILEHLKDYDTVKCVVNGTSNEKEKVGVILENSKLFIPCIFNNNKENNDLPEMCTISYDLKPYECDEELSSLDKADEERVTFNENLVQEI